MKASIRLLLEVLEDRLCLSADNPPPVAVTNPNGGVNADVWCPKNPAANDRYSYGPNWSQGVVPGGSFNTATFSGNVSNAPCTVDVDPNVDFCLSNGYTGIMYMDAGTIDITGFTDLNIREDFLDIVLSSNTLNFWGNSIFGNLNIGYAAGGAGTVYFPQTSNAVMGNQSSLSVEIDPKVSITGTVSIGDAYGSGSLSTTTIKGNVSVQGAGVYTGSLVIYGENNGTANPLVMTNGTTISVNNKGKLYLMGQPNSVFEQGLMGVSITCYTGGTVIVNSGNWVITGANSFASTIEIQGGTMNINGDPHLICQEDPIVEDAIGAVININDNCNVSSDLLLSSGSLTFNGLFQLYVQGNVDIESEETINAQTLNNVSGQSSNLYATGTISINGGFIYVTGVGGGTPPSGYSWNLLSTAGNGITGDFSEAFTNVPGMIEKVQTSPYANWTCYIA